jgi:hypothetical protein
MEPCGRRTVSNIMRDEPKGYFLFLKMLYLSVTQANMEGRMGNLEKARRLV